jgi:hypothetical protein
MLPQVVCQRGGTGTCRRCRYQCTVGKGGFRLAGAGGSFVLVAPARPDCEASCCARRLRRLTLGVGAAFRFIHLSIALRLRMTRRPNVTAKTRRTSARTSSPPYDAAASTLTNRRTPLAALSYHDAPEDKRPGTAETPARDSRHLAIGGRVNRIGRARLSIAPGASCWLSWPRIGLDNGRSVRALHSDTPPTRSVARRQQPAALRGRPGRLDGPGLILRRCRPWTVMPRRTSPPWTDWTAWSRSGCGALLILVGHRLRSSRYSNTSDPETKQGPPCRSPHHRLATAAQPGDSVISPANGARRPAKCSAGRRHRGLIIVDLGNYRAFRRLNNPASRGGRQHVRPASAITSDPSICD